MRQLGIDLTQFAQDPYGSGIQRVLQQLARHWPAPADWVVPDGDRFALLDSEQADRLVSIAFEPREPGDDLRKRVREAVADLDVPRLRERELMTVVDGWLLPEPSYDPKVLRRFAAFHDAMPTAMIGYDALPMTEPANYRFRPGTAEGVSEYFRLLAVADAVACISEHSRLEILRRLRRDPALRTTVAHPGGDHVDDRSERPRQPRTGPARLLRVGTLEARKQPVQILDAFLRAVGAGLDAELTFVGIPSPSDDRINVAIRAAIAAGAPVRWIEAASDAEVDRELMRADAFLSIGIEGYGIPVLEAIRAGTPVLFAGIQPAAELMVGHGALRIDGADLASGIAGGTRAATSLRADGTAVPTWAAFAAGVANLLG